jgi:hypothetical protein
MADKVTRLVLRIEDDQGDREELARLTDALRRELLDLDVATVQQPSAGTAPPGSRAFDIAALGTLVVTLAKSELLAAVVSAVASWLANRRNQTVKVEIDGDVLELTGLPSGERQRLTDEWLRRQAADRSLPAGSRSALIIASHEYQDPGLRRLRSPAHDAEALARVLGDPRIGGFEVRTLLDAPSYEITEAVEEFFADRSPDDLLLMHFSGHGVKDEGGELHFATANTKLRRLGATAVAADFVNRRMSRSRSRRIVLLLDCCYAGAFERGMTARAGTSVNIEEQFGGRGRAVITASSSMEYAFEGDELTDARELTPSVFTSALVEGLETGEADRDQDGQVSLDELYDYVYDRVRVTTPNQTPGKWTFGVQGGIFVARRARPVTTPAALPSELQEAVDHPIATVRLGAVQELARLLGSRHAGLALAARLALEHLADGDSRVVAAAAAQALAAGPKQPDTPPPMPLAQPSHSRPAPRQAEVPPSRRPGSEVAEPEGTAAPARAFTLVAQALLRLPGPRPDRDLGIAGAVAVLGAILLVVSSLAARRGLASLLGYPEILWHVVVFAAVALMAGLATGLLRTGNLIAPGVLIGAAAASTSELVNTTFLILGQPSFADLPAGIWLHFAGQLALAVAGLLAIRALRRLAGVRVGFGRPHGATSYLLLVLGLVNGAALAVLWDNALQSVEASRFWLLWTAAAAVLVAVSAAAAVPRGLGAALLGGWAAGGAGLYLSLINLPILHYSVAGGGYVGNSFGVYLFGGSLLAMLIAAVPLSWRGITRPAPPMASPART